MRGGSWGGLIGTRRCGRTGREGLGRCWGSAEECCAGCGASTFLRAGDLLSLGTQVMAYLVGMRTLRLFTFMVRQHVVSTISTLRENGTSQHTIGGPPNRSMPVFLKCSLSCSWSSYLPLTSSLLAAAGSLMYFVAMKQPRVCTKSLVSTSHQQICV